MVKITFYKSNGVFYAFEETGHSGYADSGNDIVCAAISAMTMLVVNAIEVSYASDVEYIIDEKTTDIKVIARGALPAYEESEQKRFAVSGIIQAFFFELNDLVEEYYDFLTVDEVEEMIV